jgi:hypothetical protein
VCVDGIFGFLWTAFFDYWKSWVTGTGIVGFLLFLLSWYERHRKKTVSRKTYVAVLFCPFWFFGTFSAWHDAQKNLKSVILQREKDTGDLGICTSNLRTESTLKVSWQDRFADQQKVINSLQSPQLQQQATLNSCVVSLGKMNPIVNTKPGVVVIQVATETKPPIVRFGLPTKTYWYAIVLSINKRINFAGRLKCSHQFKPGIPEMSLRVLVWECPGLECPGRSRMLSTFFQILTRVAYGMLPIPFILSLPVVKRLLPLVLLRCHSDLLVPMLNENTNEITCIALRNLCQ